MPRFCRICCTSLVLLSACCSASLAAQKRTTSDSPRVQARGRNDKNMVSSSAVEKGDSNAEYARGFKEGLEQHQDMLAELRRELESGLAQHQKDLDSARSIIRIFGILFTVVSVLFVGSVFFGFTFTQAARREITSAREEVRSAQEEVTKFTAYRQAVLSELHRYMRKAPVKYEGQFTAASLLPAERATMEELDHLTFLSNPLFRFRQPENQKEVELYSQILLQSARWYLAENQPAQALMRLEQLFAVNEAPVAKENRGLLAQAHSLKALAYFFLLAEERKERIIPRPDTKQNVQRYRRYFEESIGEAKKLDPNWSPTYVWEAMYQSISPEIPEGADPSEERRLRRAAQQRAIEIYRDSIRCSSSREPEPDYSSSALQNLCCCLKRMGDLDGNYDLLFQELRQLPSEHKLLEQHGQLSDKNAAALALWRRIMVDHIFFNKIAADVQTYSGAWLNVLAAC